MRLIQVKYAGEGECYILGREVLYRGHLEDVSGHKSSFFGVVQQKDIGWTGCGIAVRQYGDGFIIGFGIPDSLAGDIGRGRVSVVDGVDKTGDDGEGSLRGGVEIGVQEQWAVDVLEGAWVIEQRGAFIRRAVPVALFVPSAELWRQLQVDDTVAPELVRTAHIELVAGVVVHVREVRLPF